ncbi:hypothetical protein J3R30DRAFT_2898104 [Lentinula aciculospora]|uniref:Uncharacterized protein n=1 Tax=Lentinula aciculospora TaxID=153920 RepID=A0A9W9AAP7_9AGAR|nr:hypothetical protein J3R30DRAFT_2898104 [Lentinula aciculospora]
MGIFEEARQEEALRAHIRRLLYDYAKEHLTTSYIEFTEQAVTELLSQSLHKVPTTDSSSVRLPEEPFSALTRLFALNDLKSYDEEAAKSSEGMKYLKTFLATLKSGSKLRSQRAVDIDDYDCYIPDERFIPMVSRRARRETPRPGSNSFRKSLKTPYAAFLQSSKIEIKPVEVKIFKEPAVNPEKVLNVTWFLSQSTGVEVRDFLKSTAALSYPGPSYKNRYLDPSVRPDSPPLQLGRPLLFESGESFLPFVPIFSRKQRPGSGRVEIKDEQNARKEELPASKIHLFGIRKDKGKDKDTNTSTDPEDLFALGRPPPRSINQVAPKLNAAKVDEDEGFDLLKENMKIVDGWQTYHSSSPAKASQASSLSSVTTPRSSQEIDELNVNLTISSPNTDLSPIKLLKESRMAMPRSKRILIGNRGSKAAQTKKIGAKQSYAAFLLETLNKRNELLSEGDKPPTSTISGQDEIQEARSDSLSFPRNDMRSSPMMDFDEVDTNSLNLKRTEPVTEPAAKVNFDVVSVAGEAGSTVGIDSVVDLKGTENAVNVDSFGSALHAIYRAVQNEDPLDLIKKEKLDLSKDGKEILMEVPSLPPPNEHPPNEALFPASNVRQYLVPSGAGANRTREKGKVYQFLKKAKGTASATLELSWVPFAVTTSLPTPEEMLTVHDFIDKNTGLLNAFDRLGVTKEQGLARVRGLEERAREMCGVSTDDKMNQESNTGPAGEYILRAERIWEEWSCHVDEVTSNLLQARDEEKIDILLSREERRRSKRLSKSQKVERVADTEGETNEDLDKKREQENPVNSEERTVAETGSFGEMPAVDGSQTNHDSPAPVPVNLDVGGINPEPPQAYDAEPVTSPQTEFGLTYFFPEGENDIIAPGYGYGLGEDDQFFSDSLSALPVPEEYPLSNQYGYDFVENGFDSDKENQDPSEAIVQNAEREWYYSGVSPSHAYGERRSVFPNYEQDEEDRYPIAKRPRLDWEGDHRHQGQERRYDDQNLEVEDSGIGLLDYLVYSPECLADTADHSSLNLDQDDRGLYAACVDPLAPVKGDHDRVLNEEQSHIQNQFDTEDGYETLVSIQHQNSDFIPLAFDSQSVADPQSQQPSAPSVPAQAQSPLRRPFIPKAVPLTIPFHDHAVGIAEFARLRAIKLRTPPSAEPSQPLTTEVESFDESKSSKTAPEAIFDVNTLRLPYSDQTLPTTAHWYMASMHLLQKQALVRSLRSDACGVGLVERDMLVGVDLIIDPHTAVIFTNLLALPFEVDVLINTISEQSWRYDNLLLVFEAFVPSLAFKSDSATSAKESLNAYSPPVLKAVKKLRRDISLAEACENKREGCRVMTAFASTVQDAAAFARIFGDEAERRDDHGIGLWGDRAWLDDEAGEDEENLAIADGMNHFAACVILCQISLDEFLEISAEERSARFTPYVGNYRMVKLNNVIELGRQVLKVEGSVIQE